MRFVEGLPPGQAKDPDLEGKEGDVDNDQYDNNVSNFYSTPTINSINRNPAKSVLAGTLSKIASLRRST